MSGMAIPPFPSLDLAKLVLGYLAEEQLMTAYDEFLQASPYLDALRNEYDRIFMTSLKNILAEYRAVKIFVETCKPFALRKKLIQCTNLLDVVKFLINHVDLNKIQSQDTSNSRNNSEKPTSSIQSRSCEVCESLKLTACVCKNRLSVHAPTASSHSTSNSELSVRDSSIETTALSDLPGNHGSTRKRHVKTLDKDSTVSNFSSGSGQQETAVKQSSAILRNTADNQTSHTLTSHEHDYQNANIPLVKALDESQEKIKEFNDILNRVCNKNSHIQQGCVDQRVSNAGTFQDFATGMIGGDNRNYVPDSSTCENINMQVPMTKEKHCKDTPLLATAKKSRRHVKKSIVVVAKLSDNSIQSNEVIDVDAIEEVPRRKPKSEQSKIKILSDVKVGNETLNNNLNAILQNATSTPMLKMQTVMINGTPVYNPVINSIPHNFTKDEIMAMPTIIITPVSGQPTSALVGQPPQVMAQSQTIHKMPEFIPVSSSYSAQSIEPLFIEVSSNNSACTMTQPAGILNSVGQINQAQQGLITSVPSTNITSTTNTVAGSENGKPMDTISASVPKDNVIASGTETSTPQVIPPTRKSCSTPRRTSHVRVLDFTTPRRILHETINEVQTSNDAEIVLSKSPNIIVNNTVTKNDKCSKVKVVGPCGDCRQIKYKENNKSNPETSKKNWDSDLRALIAGQPSVSTNKKVSVERKKASKKKRVDKESKKEDDGKNSSPKKKVSKTKKISTRKTNKIIVSATEEPEKNSENQNVDIPIKPTINIISGHDWEASHQETEKVHKSNSDEQDTPELERISLEKVMGARLNISDLLETPYKQALYDIQMETPRFLGPDLPDEPMSDIKIMNIPTPRFLNTSKGGQATPSSYCSRPTDYSSGGSYYKPDDQDYMPLPEHIGCSISTSKDNVENKSVAEADEEQKEKNNTMKSSRPVRQCAKNVTYFNHNVNKTKDENNKALNDTIEEELTSEASFLQNSPEPKIAKEEISKKKEGTPKVRPKCDKPKSQRSASKKNKSPKKEVSKSFMKIRPRRSTPIKDVKGSKRRSSEGRAPKSQTKKRTTSKERNINSSPAAAIPTKSRRKSSIPRKLLCPNNSESSGHDSPDLIKKQKEIDALHKAHLQSAHDSDTEQLKLRWSDDGSQDGKFKGFNDNLTNDSDDISKIQEYIKTTVCSKPVVSESGCSLQIDLVKRGFDLETAKKIERDLLDTPPRNKPDTFVPKSFENEPNCEETNLEKTIESESSICNNLQIVQDEVEPDDEEEEIELSVVECNEDTNNYFTCFHDGNKEATTSVKLKDKFCMEVCMEDGVPIRLRATPFITLYDFEYGNEKLNDTQDIEETRRAVSSIKFQTPSKEAAMKAQCFEIFDSTLTSLDTPLKVNTPRISETEVTVTQIVLEVEKVEVKEKAEIKKRKRLQSGNTSDDSVTDSKKSKTEAQLLLNSATFQNMDIETVLSKLHGP